MIQAGMCTSPLVYRVSCSFDGAMNSPAPESNLRAKCMIGVRSRLSHSVWLRYRKSLLVPFKFRW